MRAIFCVLAGALILAAPAAAQQQADQQPADQQPSDQAASIQYLLDRAAIQDVVAGYAVAMDTGNLAAYGALFAEDAEFRFGNNHLVGRDAIVETMAPVLAAQVNSQTVDSTSTTRLRHMMSVYSIEIDGDTAVVHGNWFTASARTGDGVNIGGLGYFNDTMVKRDGVWLYKERVLVVELASEAAIAANNR